MTDYIENNKKKNENTSSEIKITGKKTRYGGLDENRVINKEYFSSLDEMYKCNICFKIIDNPTDCETCGHSYCYDCISNLRCPSGCEKKNLKPSSKAIQNILSGLIFKCLYEGCKEEIPYSEIKKHDTVCGYKKITCPNNGCGKILLRKDIEEHIKNECEFVMENCQYCGFEFDKNDINAHEQSCNLVGKSLKENFTFDTTKLDQKEYIQLLSMNISKIVKDNQEFLNNLNNNNNDKNNNNKNDNNNNTSNQRISFSRVSFRPSTVAQIDEDELLNIIKEGLEEKLKSYFLDFDRNFLGLSKDIKDIKDYFIKNNYNNNKPQENNILINENENNEDNVDNEQNEENIHNHNNNNNKIFNIKTNFSAIKEAKEYEEEDFDSNIKLFIKNIIEKTENEIKNAIQGLNKEITEELNKNKIKINTESNENNKNNIKDENIDDKEKKDKATEKNEENKENEKKEKIYIEEINSTINKIIDNIKETNNKINNLSENFHKSLNEVLMITNKESKESDNKENKENKDKDKELNSIEEFKKDIKNIIENNSKENYDKFSNLIDMKLNENNIIKTLNIQEEEEKQRKKEKENLSSGDDTKNDQVKQKEDDETTGVKMEDGGVTDSNGEEVKNISKEITKETQENILVLKNQIDNVINKEINSMSDEMGNVKVELSLIKNNIKQVINIINEEFSDLTNLINSNANKKEEEKKNPETTKEEKLTPANPQLEINYLPKYSFGGRKTKEEVNNIEEAKKKLTPIRYLSKTKKPNIAQLQAQSQTQGQAQTQGQTQNQSQSLNQSKNLNANTGNETQDNYCSFLSGDYNEIIPNDRISNALVNLEARMTSLENFTKNLPNELKQDISTEFDKQVNNLNKKIENNLDNKLKIMFSLKYCKECEKVDYFYGFIKCSICSIDNCKQCIVLCLSCKHLLCKNCCLCPKCTKNYCLKCRILCEFCNNKYCCNCITNCANCNKQICSGCIKECSNCKIKHCDINCSKTCYSCLKNACNDCSSKINIFKCSSCSNYLCEDCFLECENCKNKSCKSCFNLCNKCKKSICNSCIKECGQCSGKYCENCSKEELKIKCEVCKKPFCNECAEKKIVCFSCSNTVCSNCSSTCKKCDKIYCNVCSLECEKCGERTCNKCTSWCVCEVAVFCEKCIQGNEPILSHNCIYFLNNTPFFDTKKTRSLLSYETETDLEAKFCIHNINKQSKILIGITNNTKFNQDCNEVVKDKWVLDLNKGEKFCDEKGNEKLLEVENLDKEFNFVYIMVKEKKLLFKINNGEYKEAYELKGDKYNFYIENEIQNSSDKSEKEQKISFIYLRKIKA